MEQLGSIGGYKVVIDNSPRAAREVSAVLAEVYARELRWLDESEALCDCDDGLPDEHTYVLIKDANDTTVGALRMNSVASRWLLDEPVFKQLVSDESLLTRQHDCCEITRLALLKAVRGVRVFKGIGLLDLLIKATYRLSIQRGCSRNFIVISEMFLRRFLFKGIPLKLLGPIKRMDDGFRVAACELDWLDVERFQRGSSYIQWLKSDSGIINARPIICDNEAGFDGASAAPYAFQASRMLGPAPTVSVV